MAERKKLTALAVERARYKPAFNAAGKPKGNELRHEKGLFLYVTPNSVKSWRYQYRLHGRKIIVYGQYPEVSLAEAVDMHNDARKLIAAGQVPAVVNKKVIAKKDAVSSGVDNRFRAVGEAWYAAELRANPALSEAWRDNNRRFLDRAYEDFGNKPLPEVEAADVLALIKKVEAKGTPVTAEYIRQTVSRVFNYGILNLLAPRGFNPAEAIRGAVKVPKKQHRAKLEPDAIGPFIRTIRESAEDEAIKIGLEILLHTFPRRTELVLTPWTEIDGEIWKISADRMKKDREHIIPLSRQVRAKFDRLKELAGDSPWVFPGRNPRKPRNKQVFNNTLWRIGFKGVFSPHGVRSTAASILADQGYSREVVDAQLAHAEDNETMAAYFRNQYIDQRREMLQRWSDLLDGFAAGGAKVIPIGSGKAA